MGCKLGALSPGTESSSDCDVTCGPILGLQKVNVYLQIAVKIRDSVVKAQGNVSI